MLSLFVAILIIAPCLEASPFEKQLVQQLSDNGTTYTRPETPPNVPLYVEVLVDLHQLVQLDELMQTVELKLYFDVIYNNTHIFWDPSMYGGIEELEVSQSQIWLPDIVIRNRVDTVSTGYDKVKVSHSGYIEWIYPAVEIFSCELDVSEFPHDEQVCHLDVSSWALTKDKMMFIWGLDERKMPLYDYVPNSQWKLLTTHVEERNLTLQNKEFSEQIYTLKFVRLPKFFAMTLIYPTLVIGAMTILIFMLPVESGEKIGLGITLLLALSVNLLVLSSIVPASPRTFPVLGNYFFATILLIAFSLVSTVVVENIHFAKSTPSHWVRILFGYYLAKLLFKETHIKPTNKVESNVATAEERKHRKEQGKKSTVYQASPSSGKDVSALQEALVELVNQHRDDNMSQQVCEEWAIIAAVTDRLLGIMCFIAFLILNIYYNRIFIY